MALRNISPEHLIVAFLFAGCGTGALLWASGISSVWGMRIVAGTLAVFLAVMGLLIFALIIVNAVHRRRKGDD